MHHHTIKTKTGEINVFVIKQPTMMEPEVLAAMERGVVIVAQSEKRAAEILAKHVGAGIGEFKQRLASKGWQGAWDYFKGEN